MSFIRIKKISGKEYAYLVENKWYKRGFKGKGKGSRQSVSKYLGRVYSFDQVSDIDFLEFVKRDTFEAYLSDNIQEKVIKDLILWEMSRNGISSDISVDFKSKKILFGKKEVCLKINEGFLCKYTFRRLFNLRSEDSYYLAKCFIDAGIEIPRDLFVGMFVE